MKLDTLFCLCGNIANNVSRLKGVGWSVLAEANVLKADALLR